MLIKDFKHNLFHLHLTFFQVYKYFVDLENKITGLNPLFFIVSYIINKIKLPYLVYEPHFPQTQF
jgi:hypothetical protein